MTAPQVLLGRMRANAAEALSQGATLAEVQSHLLAVTRGVSRPGQTEADDGLDVAELVAALNESRGVSSPGGGLS